MKLTVRQWRMAREISQNTMAELLGVHINTYINWEKNPENISIKYALMIAKIFAVKLDDIIFLS